MVNHRFHSADRSTYERIPQQQQMVAEELHSRRRNGIRWLPVRAFLVATTLLVATLIAAVGVPVSLRKSLGFDASTAPQASHPEVIPTLLQVVDPNTNEYLYALDNPLYERLKRAFFFLDKALTGQAAHPVQIQLHLNSLHVQVRDSLTLTWTNGVDKYGDPVSIMDEDVIVLHCGHEHVFETENLNDKHILEAATVAQARATSLKHGGVGENEWYLPKFPVFRQDVCQFMLYRVGDTEKDTDTVHHSLMAESPVFHSFFVTSPTAIHLALAPDPSTMVVNFVTGGTGSAVAMYGTTDTTNKVTGTTTTYTAQDLCQAPANVTEAGKFQPPGSLHTIELTDLQPNTTYHYKVGLAFGQGITWSDTFRFTSAPVVGDPTPFSYVVYGDQGCPSKGWGYGGLYTAALTAREVERTVLPARAVHHFGDLSYAMGAAHIWDEWFDMIQPFSTRVPLMVGVGNHEYDHTDGGGIDKDPSGVETLHGFSPAWGNFHNDSGGECGVPTAKRFTMPQHISSKKNSIASNGVFWYSYDFASVHTTVISSEHDLSPGAPQHAWLEQDLQSVNRTLTPWVVVESHRPMYEGEAGHWESNAVGIAMRYEMEDLLHDHHVDLFLSGHYHAYHRSCSGLYRSQCYNGGPTHITVGSAGAQLDDTPHLFSNTWSAKFTNKEYGYGRITVMNATTMNFEFVRAGDQNDTSAGDVHDQVWITR